MSFLTILLAATLSSGNAEFDATARDGARAIAVARVKAELAEKGPASGALEGAMLADPAAYEKPAEAEKLCRGVFAAEVAKQFAEKVRAIDERLGMQPGDTSLGDAESAAISERHFATAFAAERKAAVEAQAKTIVSTTRPTEADFDSKEDWQLREQMQQCVLNERGTPVFS